VEIELVLKMVEVDLVLVMGKWVEWSDGYFVSAGVLYTQSQYHLSELLKYILAIVTTSLCSYTCMESAEEPGTRRPCSMRSSFLKAGPFSFGCQYISSIALSIVVPVQRRRNT
jgi:hypothetical protein